MSSALIRLLEPIQAEYLASKEWQDVDKRAYPSPPEAPKKQKKPKNLGSRFPGGTGPAAAGQAEAKPDGHIEGDRSDKLSVSANAETAIKSLRINDS